MLSIYLRRESVEKINEWWINAKDGIINQINGLSERNGVSVSDY